jgi:hypothetical protein
MIGLRAKGAAGHGSLWGFGSIAAEPPGWEDRVMRHSRPTALCVVAVFAFVTVAVASASAEPPEFEVKNKKTAELEPLKKPVKFTDSSGLTLRSGTSELNCAASSAKGKLTGPKTLIAKTTYTGCEDPISKATCQSGRKAGVIKTASMEATLVDASANLGEPLVVAVSAPAPSGYTCGTTTFVVTGLALGTVAPTGESTSELSVTYAEGEESAPGCGKQELQLVQGLAPCTHLEIQVGVGPGEPAWMVRKEKKDMPGHVILIK